MHACLLHIYNHAFTLFILIVIYPQKLVMSTNEQRYLKKTDLLSCLRQAFGYILVSYFKAPE
jgi:hypothetical protein